jgi:hypothetical protein
MLLRFGVISNRTANNANKLRSFSKRPTYHITINQPKFVAGFNLDKVRRIDVSGDRVFIYYDQRSVSGSNSCGYRGGDTVSKENDPDTYEKLVHFVGNGHKTALHDSVCE